MRLFLRLVQGGATRVLEFLEDYPDPNPGYLAARESLGGLLTQSHALMTSREAGKATGKRAASRRKPLAERIVNFNLRPLRAVAVVAHRGHEDRLVHYRVPERRNMTATEFLAATQAILDVARQEEALLLAKGLPATLLAELEEGLAEYSRLPMEATAGRNTATTAHDSLERVGQEMLDQIQYLDGLMQHRFKDEPDLLAAWTSARNIPWPRRRKKAEPPATPPAEVGP